MGKKFDELMSGRTPEEQQAADERKVERAAMAGKDVKEIPPAPARWEEGHEPKPELTNDEFVGYVTAVIMPIVGVLVGCALIVKGSDRAAGIVGWATAFWIIWSAVISYGLTAGWFT